MLPGCPPVSWGYGSILALFHMSLKLSQAAPDMSFAWQQQRCKRNSGNVPLFLSASVSSFLSTLHWLQQYTHTHTQIYNRVREYMLYTLILEGGRSPMTRGEELGPLKQSVSTDDKGSILSIHFTKLLSMLHWFNFWHYLEYSLFVIQTKKLETRPDSQRHFIDHLNTLKASEIICYFY